MVFIDEDGNEKATLLECGFKFLTSIKVQCYYFTFGPMEEVDTTSILMRMQQYHNQGVFNPKEFIDFRRTRKIKFRVTWIPCRVFSFRENLRHLIFITKYNLKSK